MIGELRERCCIGDEEERSSGAFYRECCRKRWFQGNANVCVRESGREVWFQEISQKKPLKNNAVPRNR